MRALYINLDRSPDRRQWIERQAASLGLDLERIAAVDGLTLDHVPDGLSAGALACFQSHRKAWEMIAEGDDRMVAIFEDDVHMSPDLPRFLRDISWIPGDADIVHIGRSRERCIVINERHVALDRALYKTVTENSGTESYVISRSCAARLHREFIQIGEEFDSILFNDNAFALTIYKLVPSLCMQDQLMDTPRFNGQIERKPRQRQQMSWLGRETRRHRGKLKRATALLFGLKRPVRIRVEFR